MLMSEYDRPLAGGGRCGISTAILASWSGCVSPPPRSTPCARPRISSHRFGSASTPLICAGPPPAPVFAGATRL